MLNVCNCSLKQCVSLACGACIFNFVAQTSAQARKLALEIENAYSASRDKIGGD